MSRTATWLAMRLMLPHWRSCREPRSPGAWRLGRSRGGKVFALQTLPANEALTDNEAGKVAGFSLHAGVAARADQRDKLERLRRYICRPAISGRRLSLTPVGNVRYQLKTPYRDGTTHVVH